jgi:DNA-binding CsgD family transcriptional regulator
MRTSSEPSMFGRLVLTGLLKIWWPRVHRKMPTATSVKPIMGSFARSGTPLSSVMSPPLASFVARRDREFSDDAAVLPGAAQPPLTPRQLSVARAAASGLSNRAIATELYISIKTVEYHIAQILAKLGLDSRTQIAGALTAADVDADHDRAAADLPA